MSAVKEFFKGSRSLAEGMAITIKHFFRRPVTVDYPREKAPISKAQRNAITLIPKDEVGGSHNCIACLQCQKICPSNCISITGYRPDGLAMKRPETFDVNFALCSECGLCLDVCPTNTLGYSKTYDNAGYNRDDFTFDLLEKWRDGEEQALETLREADRKKKAEREAKKKADEAAKKAKAAAEAAKKEAEAKSADAEPKNPPAGTSEK